jgi:tetratricopeptide (TPR) repeat protein
MPVMPVKKKNQSVPKIMQPMFDNVTELTDAVCKDKLNEEYAELARDLTAALCRKRPCPLCTGYIDTWAAGIVYALGQINFLFDKSQTPHLRADELAEAFGVSKSTASCKASVIKKLFKMNAMGSSLLLPSRVDGWGPAWMIQVNGLLVDARNMPYEIQEEAFSRGMIPYLPERRPEDEARELHILACERASEGEFDKAIKLFKQVLEIMPDMMGAKVGLSLAYDEIEDKKKSQESSEQAYQDTLKHFPEWPTDFTWGIIEYRPYLRAICNHACRLHIDGKSKEAEKLYRVLLKFTPHDNQGVRYLLAGLHAGISPKDVDQMTEEGNERQDWSALENMLEKQNSKHNFWVEPEDL